MTITINGKRHDLADQNSIALPDLIRTLQLGEKPLLVELNRQAILKREFDGCVIRDGDEVEIIRMVAGG